MVESAQHVHCQKLFRCASGLWGTQEQDLIQVDSMTLHQEQQFRAKIRLSRLPNSRCWSLDECGWKKHCLKQCLWGSQTLATQACWTSRRIKTFFVLRIKTFKAMQHEAGPGPGRVLVQALASLVSSVT